THLLPSSPPHHGVIPAPLSVSFPRKREPSAGAAPPIRVSPTLHRGRTGKMGVATGTEQWISASGRDDAAGERRTHTAPSPPDAAQRRLPATPSRHPLLSPLRQA